MKKSPWSISNRDLQPRIVFYRSSRTLDWSGNEWVAGLISVGSSSTPPTPTANNHLTTKKYVDDIVGNIETLLASI